MKINLPTPFYKANTAKLNELGIVSQDRFSYHDFLSVDLTGRSVGEVKALAGFLETSISEVGDKKKTRHLNAALRNANAWLMLQNGSGELPKAKGCEDAAQLLKAYIATTERKHLYRMTSGEEGSVPLAYYVRQIEYNRPRGRDNPAYTQVYLTYIKFGSVENSSITFYAEECRGRTPQEILEAHGYSLETPVLRDDYEYYLTRFEEILGQVGEQYLAVGIGVEYGSERYWSRDRIRMEDDEGKPSKVVVDVFHESKKERGSSQSGKGATGKFWNPEGADDEDTDSDEIPELFEPEVPHHPYVVCFHLKQHQHLSIHVNNLEPYVYNENVRDNLVLPEVDEQMLDVLLADSRAKFTDVVEGKTGGTVVLSQGPPGTGKTLTAEVYAEGMKRPLYNVQCSQLGLNAEELEKNLDIIFARAQRWRAVLLLDEADVYIHERGDDLYHNAIVGVFLRLLEYYDGVLFMTTNRGDTVDDAVLSRCTARLTYGVPPVHDQYRIWKVLAKANGLTYGDDVYRQIVKKHDDLSGRDIKNLLKLCMMVVKHNGVVFDSLLVDQMRRFKATIKK